LICSIMEYSVERIIGSHDQCWKHRGFPVLPAPKHFHV
jgi:hypothetical protein